MRGEMQAQTVEDLRWGVDLVFGLLDAKSGKQNLWALEMDGGSGYIDSPRNH